MASASRRRQSARGPPAQTGLPDEMWWEILLRLDAAADLARASAACSSFRRVVSEHRFLRRFRSLHSPPILGFIRHGLRHEYLPVEPPHRSAGEARALQQAADFTFSFLPDPSAWRFRHARDGRVLAWNITKTQFEDLLVCDPLHRRYVRIPPIPTDLMASTPRTARHLSPVLAPAGENEEEESFRVICTVLFEGKAVAFIFSSSNQTWQAIISMVSLPDGFIEYVPCYAHGCLYWMFLYKGYSLMLNTSEMEFSIIEFPTHNFYVKRVIVEADERRLRFITIADGIIGLYCKNWQRDGVWVQDWQQDKLIPLPKDSGTKYTSWTVVGTLGHNLALLGGRQISHELRKQEYFVLDTKILHLEKACVPSNSMFFGIPYAGFPPPFALPSI